MKFLVVGLGSMGKRRIRNLQHLKAGEISGFDPRAERGQEAHDRYGIPVYSNLEQAMETAPDAMIISTPPDLHVKYALIAAEEGKHFFTEASVVDDGMDELMELCKKRDLVAAPSCTMRFHPSVRLIKDLIDAQEVNEPLGFTYHSGQYLPDWHPWEDYRTFYVAKRATGACREIVPFELTWLTWVIGEVESLSCIKGKLSALDVDIDDLYQMLLRFKRGTIGHMQVDVISRVPYRTFRLISDQAVIDWNWGDKRVRVFRVADGTWKEYQEPETITEGTYIAAENMYIDEMNAFVQAARGEKNYPYTLEEDKRILDLLYAAEKSSDEGITVQTA